uniref:Uncharacterized protein n=1 Tax=Chlorella vulgaris TaxID=3077 RepID=V9H1A0_CHLVU|nr:hypothetical protein ChvulCp078 [Chlorella vulgaris]pir/T07265/ hypothetical protein 58 - Chlorella vulgaris chloroplast [Chlorella vulgaris]BAA57913.1 unnamed protein product [Chlorella vulgaris]
MQSISFLRVLFLFFFRKKRNIPFSLKFFLSFFLTSFYLGLVEKRCFYDKIKKKRDKHC